MSRNTKAALVIGAALLILGAALFACALGIGGWDIMKLSTEEYTESTHTFDTDISDISIVTDTADVFVARSSDGVLRVVCDERVKMPHSVTAENGVLKISLKDEGAWYEHISFFSFGKERIYVYLPAGEYGSLSVIADTGDVAVASELSFSDVSISVSTGDVKVNSAVAGDIKINVSTGKVVLEGVRCGSFYSEGDTGNVYLDDVVATGAFYVERSTGDVVLDASDAASVKIKTDTGDVVGTILTDKIFAIKTSTGRVSAPDSATGGACNIETDTGDIKIEIVK